MTKHIYGVIDSNGVHHDASKTEKGAKQYATRNGYRQVSIRFNCGYVVSVVAEKIAGKWVKV